MANLALLAQPANLTYSRRMKLSEGVEAFIRERRANGYSKHTLDGYRSDLEQLIGMTPVNTVLRLDHQLMIHYFEEMSGRGAKLATLARKRSCLNEFCKWLMLHGILADNPMAKVKRIKKPDQSPRPYSPDERDRLMNLPLEGLDAILRGLLYYTGIRVTPLTQLKVGDLTFSPMTVEGITFPGTIRSLQKGNKYVISPMYPDLRDMLANWINGLVDQKPYSWLLPYHLGKPMARVTVERKCHAWGQLAGVQGQCIPHRFRHTFGTDLVRLGVHPKVIQVLMGHADIKTTMGYARVSGGQTAEAILKLPSYKS
jgi:site-specific recombinase XerD